MALAHSLRSHDWPSHPSNNTRGHQLKLRKQLTTCKQRENFLTNRIVNKCNALPATVVNADSVNIFKKMLDDYIVTSKAATAQWALQQKHTIACVLSCICSYIIIIIIIIFLKLRFIKYKLIFFLILTFIRIYIESTNLFNLKAINLI